MAEVIRFLHVDFRQHFFDMPGTPLIALTAILWSFGLSTGTFLGFIYPPEGGLENFTFDHLPQLFALMRAETLFFALSSIVLVFLLASKLTNRVGACIAAFVLMMSPTYSSYTALIRVESLSMCFILASALSLLHGLRCSKHSQDRGSPEVRWILLAGLLAGLAAANRFHSITASLPLLLLLLWTSQEPGPVYPDWMVRWWKHVLTAGLVAACVGVIAIKTGYLPHSSVGIWLTTNWPNAFVALYPLVILTAILCAVTLTLHRVPHAKWLAERVQHPRMLVLFTGICAGCLAGTPTILWQGKYFFQSINAYSTTYFDLDRMNWPLTRNIAWYLKFYFGAIAPDYLTMTLLAVGAGLVLIKRDKLLLPFLVTGLLFFVSKPIKLMAAPHHIILWLPFYSIVMGYGVATTWDALGAKIPNQPVLRSVALTGLFVALGLVMVRGPQYAAANTRMSEIRLRSVSLATDWIHQNAQRSDLIAISYYCFNPDVFFTWLQGLEVPVPDDRLGGGRYMIWWGQHSPLKHESGYACAAPEDIQSIKHVEDLRSSGEGTNPFADEGFQLVQSFGKGPNEIDVFKFNFQDQK